MWYFFHFANNFIDRLATSNEAQPTRDFAETILKIGYQESMEAEGYFCAARAYTLQKQFSCRTVLYGDYTKEIAGAIILY